MIRGMRALLPAMMFLLLLASCGGAPSGGDGSGGEPSTGGEDAIPSAPGWATMSHDDRAAWMAQEVVPRMETMFLAYDAERFADFSCRTCHGEGAANGDFEMPSRSLPALHPTGSPEQHRMLEDYRDGCTFMFQEVLPTMQRLLGAPGYDEATQQGFSCYACHPHAGEEGTTPLITLPPTDGAGDAG